jgi:hypothetical protein
VITFGLVSKEPAPIEPKQVVDECEAEIQPDHRKGQAGDGESRRIGITDRLPHD